MAITLDNTINGESANSYCDVTYADSYFAGLPKAASNAKSLFWVALQPQEKQQILVQACWNIEEFKFTEKQFFSLSDVHLAYDSVNHMNYYTVPGMEGIPVKWNPFQQLQFPRNLDMKSDGTLYVPDRVLQAQCEQAYYLANLDESVLANVQMGLTYDSFTGGGISTTQRYQQGVGNSLSPIARNLLKQYMLRSVKRFERT